MGIDWREVFNVIIQGFGAVFIVLLILMLALMGSGRLINWIETSMSSKN